VPVIVNIAGETVDDYARLAAELDGIAGISGIEANISCPNIRAGGVEFGTDPDSAARVTAAVRDATSLPLVVKLTPNTGEIGRIAAAVADAGADAISLINTLRGLLIDIDKRHPVLGNNTGGLSGPAIKPVALAMVYEVAGVVDIPVIGCGGISSGNDAVEFIMAGATAVQVGTATFANPRAPLDILEGIEKFLIEQGKSRLTDLFGIARR
jgi:dihydroorotate dehydrogenase (NAD+) catalytic subunit